MQSIPNDGREATVVGLDVGGTKTAVVEGTRDGEILQRSEIATSAERPFDTIFPYLAALMENTLEKAKREGRSVIALSVSIGGPLKIGEGVLIDPPHLPGWHGVPLKERLRERFPGLPVFVEHDGNAGALAEFHLGIGRQRAGVRHLVFLTFGTGLGSGLIVNGQIVYGASGTAGEVGHWRLAPTGPVGFGKAGSWEGFASGAGMVQLAASMFPERWTPETPIRSLVADMLTDDPEALQVAEAAGRWMGQGMALLVDVLNPQVIVLGSLAVALGDRVLGPARQVLAAEALPQAVETCDVIATTFGRHIGDVAALMAALRRPDIQQQLAASAEGG